MKRAKLFMWLVVLAGFFFGLRYVLGALPIISGYGAKNLCSCVFVSGRTIEDVKSNELKTNPLLAAGNFNINYSDSSATGDVFGFYKKKAIYRKGLGCTLISEVTEAEIRSQEIDLILVATAADSLYWPLGSKQKDSIFSNVDYPKLTEAISNAFIEDIPGSKINTRGVVVVYKNQIIGEQYASGFDENTPQMGWSMTKSVTATLIAMLQKDGKLDIMDRAPVASWQNDERKNITIDQLLRMSSGLDFWEFYALPSSAVEMLYEKADMGVFAASSSLEYEPGEKWYYSSGTSNILSGIIRDAVGDADYHNYVRQRLFSPLGMTSAVLEPDASGTYVGSSYMYATPRDWAKFGLLYLNDGVWNGERILPEGWIEYVSTATLNAPKGEYGAHFWLNAKEKSDEAFCYYPDAPSDLYSANGFEGQRVFIIPSRDMVIVRLGQTKDREDFDFNEFLESILATVD